MCPCHDLCAVVGLTHAAIVPNISTYTHAVYPSDDQRLLLFSGVGGLQNILRPCVAPHTTHRYSSTAVDDPHCLQLVWVCLRAGDCESPTVVVG